jgi:hypothetical protein
LILKIRSKEAKHAETAGADATGIEPEPAIQREAECSFTKCTLKLSC